MFALRQSFLLSDPMFFAIGEQNAANDRNEYANNHDAHANDNALFCRGRIACVGCNYAKQQCKYCGAYSTEHDEKTYKHSHTNLPNYGGTISAKSSQGQVQDWVTATNSSVRFFFEAWLMLEQISSEILNLSMFRVIDCRRTNNAIYVNRNHRIARALHHARSSAPVKPRRQNSNNSTSAFLTCPFLSRYSIA